jgi:O-antigen ligase
VLAQGYVSLELNRAYYFDGFNQVQMLGFGGMDNNSMGVGLVSTIGPALALAVSAKKWWSKAIAFAATGFILHATLLTFSRGAMLGLVVVIVVAAMVMPKRPKYLVGIVVLSLLAVRLTGPELVSRFQSAFAEEDQLDGSAESRIELWRDCFTVAAAHPLFGIGPDNWPLIAQSFGWSRGKAAHSVWMQTMAELGFPGAFLLAAFYVTAVLWMLPVARDRGRLASSTGDAAMATGIITALAGYAVSGQFVSLQGLEIPFYVTMAGVIMLQQPTPVTSPAKAADTINRPAGWPAVAVPATRERLL